MQWFGKLFRRPDTGPVTRHESGNEAAVQRDSHEVWRWPAFESVSNDSRAALRQLRKSPGFAAAVIATLALGLGSSTAMFTVVDSVLLRPLPYNQPSQLVEIKQPGKYGPSWGATFLQLEEWRERSHTLASIAFHIWDKPICFLDGDSSSLEVNAPRISANLFSTLGVRPRLGRDFIRLNAVDFAETSDTKTILLSDSVWRDGFGARTDILGKIVKLNGDSYTVIGVMPRGFQFPFNSEKPQVWTPIVLDAAAKTREYRVIARLKDDVRIDAARADLDVVQERMAQESGKPDAPRSVLLQKYGDSIVEGNVRTALLVLLAASVMLWLMACVNVTGLLLARATTRQREIAVRSALGASRWRVMRQLLVEGLVLSGAAVLVGLALVLAALKLFEHELTAKLGSYVVMKPDWRVTSALFGLSILSGVGSSLWPALVAAKTSIEPALRHSGLSGGMTKTQHRMRASLVAAEIAMSLTLLIACGLLLRTIYELRHVSLGFRTDHVIVVDMAIPAYKFDEKNMTTELYEPLAERVEHLPGVQAAALINGVPLAKKLPMLFSMSPQDLARNAKAARREEDLYVQFRAVGPELDRVLGFRMLRGRFFNQRDTPGSEPVIVVNRAFVRAYFGNDRDPGEILGEELPLSYQNDKPARIVGVLDDQRQASVPEESKPEIEVCLPQITPESGFYGATEGSSMTLAVRTERSPSALIPELREVLREASPELVGSSFSTMDQVVEDSYGDQRIAERLLEIFAGSGLLVCVAGLYALLAYMVTERTQELGVRIALGALREQVIWLVLGQAGRMLLTGCAIGLVLSYFSGRLLVSFLYGVRMHDAWTTLAASVVLMSAGLAAAYIPAKRAASIDPMEALRTE